MLNPYASQLGDLDPLEVIAATPAKLRALMDAIGGERAEQPRAPGKWSAREIVCHLADCEVAFAFRLRQTLAEARHVMQPFDQEAWATKICRLQRGGCAGHVLGAPAMEPGAGAVARRRGSGAARLSS